MLSTLAGCSSEYENERNTESELIMENSTENNEAEYPQDITLAFMDKSVTNLMIRDGVTGDSILISDSTVLKDIDLLLGNIHMIEKEEISNLAEYPIKNAAYIIHCIDADGKNVISICLYSDKIMLDDETWLAEKIVPVITYIENLFVSQS